MKIGKYLISDEKCLIQNDRVFEMLSATYFVKGRTKDTIAKSIDNSICFGIYIDDVQVGFARCITDYATTYYLCYVVVDEKYRGHGLGKALTKFIVEHESLSTSMGVLGMEDAHSLYEKFGFMCDKGMYRPSNSTVVAFSQ